MTLKIVTNRIKIKIMKKGDDKEIVKQQSNLKFRGSLKLYTIYDSCIFKQSEVLMDKLNYIGFAVLELIKLLT